MDSSATVSTSPSDVPVVTTSDSSTTKSSSPPDVTSDSSAVTTSDVTTDAPAATTSDVTTDAPAVTTSESTTAHQDPDVTTDSQVVPTTDGTEVITLNCTATQMIVNIPVSLLEPGVVKAKDICFQNATDMTDDCCGLRADDSEIIKLETDLTGCGTTMEELNATELYSNKITTKESELISRQYAVDITIDCSYGRNQQVGNIKYQLNDYNVNKDLNEGGEYDFSFDIYEDEEYTEAVDYPVKIGLNEDLYFAASVDSLGQSLDLSIQSCRATPTSNYDSGNKYEFIKDG
ncbi:ZP domain-containing protein-like [Lytechinus variegatus]|uniref:ZP domain-containing protein-like n=1 Tax=Lytechinus variegatus TaxID=7654 RepID=UPI001BB126A0|nr:ZP domain-containing protein-like [Lytechinus variegatus]